MFIEHWLFKLGVPTYTTQIYKTLDAAAGASIELGDDVPTNLGWIYGMAINTEGAKPTSAVTPLISTANAYNLWLTVKYGTNDVINTFRLSNLVYNNPSANSRLQELNYTPVSIPYGGDWRKSLILNPTLISGVTVMLDLYFIDIPTYNNLLASGVLWAQGKKPNG